MNTKFMLITMAISQSTKIPRSSINGTVTLSAQLMKRRSPAQSMAAYRRKPRPERDEKEGGNQPQQHLTSFILDCICSNRPVYSLRLSIRNCCSFEKTE